MVDATRALLDELMGKERNLLPNERQNVGTHFSDPEVCKHFLCGFCPHQLFINTKSDLGNCTKIHDDLLKADYQNNPKKHQYGYERDFILYLERLIEDLDKKIRKGHDRLDPWAKDMKGLGGPLLSTENAEKVNTISEKINTLLQQIESLGEEGKVDECQQLMKTVDQLKAEKEQIIAASNNSISAQEKRMKVCEICGALLVVGDTEKRMASHLEGKQHIGYDMIRKTLEDFKKNHRSEYESFKRDRERPRDNKPRDYDRPRYDRRDRDNRDNRDYRDNRDNRDYRDYRDRDRERDRSGNRRRDYDTYYDRDSDRDRKKPREEY